MDHGLRPWVLAAPNTRGYRNNCGRPPKVELRRRLDFIDGSARKRAVELLFAGAVSGFLGFAFAGFLGIWQSAFSEVQLNFRGEPMESGRNYFPETVSEMVRDPASPSGKCFFAFGLIAAICILLSYYPFYLRNTYVGDDHITVLNISWLTLRTFMPPVGLLLTCCITAVPMSLTTKADLVATSVHCAGAGMMIAGYAVFELHALFLSKVVQIGELEWWIRLACVVGVAVSGGLFTLFGWLSLNATKLGICCADVWRVPVKADWEHATSLDHPGIAMKAMEAYDEHRKMLLNTANSTVFLIKHLEYWTEVFSGLFMVSGLLCIWYFSHERHFDLIEDIPDVNLEHVKQSSKGAKTQ